MREPSADADPHTVLVLAQQGTPDTRSLQPLAPLVTVTLQLQHNSTSSC